MAEKMGHCLGCDCHYEINEKYYIDHTCPECVRKSDEKIYLEMVAMRYMADQGKAGAMDVKTINRWINRYLKLLEKEKSLAVVDALLPG